MCQLMNNLDVNQTVSYSSNGVNGSAYILLPGLNTIEIPISVPFNPYELGTISVDFKLYNSQSSMIYENQLVYTVQMSTWSLIVGYILPLLIPAVLIVVVRHIDIENKKRLS